VRDNYYRTPIRYRLKEFGTDCLHAGKLVDIEFVVVLHS